MGRRRRGQDRCEKGNREESKSKARTEDEIEGGPCVGEGRQSGSVATPGPEADRRLVVPRLVWRRGDQRRRQERHEVLRRRRRCLGRRLGRRRVGGQQRLHGSHRRRRGGERQGGRVRRGGSSAGQTRSQLKRAAWSHGGIGGHGAMHAWATRHHRTRVCGITGGGISRRRSSSSGRGSSGSRYSRLHGTGLWRLLLRLFRSLRRPCIDQRLHGRHGKHERRRRRRRRCILVHPIADRFEHVSQRRGRQGLDDHVVHARLHAHLLVLQQRRGRHSHDRDARASRGGGQTAARRAGQRTGGHRRRAQGARRVRDAAIHEWRRWRQQQWRRRRASHGVRGRMRRSPLLLQLANALARRDAVHHGHAHVEQHDVEVVRRVRLVLLHCLKAVVGHDGRVTLARQKLQQHLLIHQIVLGTTKTHTHAHAHDNTIVSK